MVPTFIICLVIGLTAGCASLTRETYVRPDVSTPKTWAGQSTPGQQNAGWPDQEWWKCFQSAELNHLIDTAQSNNYDLKAAVARVAEARAGARIAGAGLYPVLTAGAGAGQSKSGGTPSVGNFNVGPQVNYEIDIWGKNRFIADSADATLLSTVFAGDSVRITLTADVAATYFQLLSLNDRLNVAHKNLANAQSLMDLINLQRKVGKVSDLEVERQRTQVANTEATIPPVLQQIRVTQDALAVLLGKNPNEIDLQGGSLRMLPMPALIAGLPSDLLERRPDIRKAETDLIAASADIGAARAALYPQISLSGSGGLASTALSALFNPSSAFYSLSANLLGTLFDGGKLKGQVELSKARKEELIAIYHQSIVSAFQDVEDSLAGIEQLNEQEEALRRTVLHAREAYRLAEMSYRLGQTDFTTVLLAEETMISAEAAVDPILFGRFTALVNLYRALGGGWGDPTKTAQK
jgi:NodT family efflux transporter outer membrane factor (OMF) lipoprotein